jgi:inorganic triphosphatase YgiF
VSHRAGHGRPPERSVTSHQITAPTCADDQPVEDEQPVEIEAKLSGPQRAFRSLAEVEEVAGWRVVARRAVRLRDTYWDTPDDRLLQEGCTLRLREQDGAPWGELTFKGAARRETGASRSRVEITARAPAGSGPPEWARLPEAGPVLAELERRDALGDLRPAVVLLNPRRELLLRRGGSEVALSLDEMRIEGRPYVRRYVELELRRGSRADLEALVQAIRERFGLRVVYKGKVHAAREWLARRGHG